MTLHVRQPGIQTTVQDLGRPATQHLGVPVGGPMDRAAHRIANLLVGNDEDAAAIECAFGGVALQATGTTLLALTGRRITASCDGRAVAAWRPIVLHQGEQLVIHDGCRTTIAVAGGIDVPVLLGARGTSMRGGFGGFQGRALRRDDVLPLGVAGATSRRIMMHLAAAARTQAPWGAGPSLRPSYDAGPVLRIIAGPELSLLSATARATFLSDSFRIAPDSDRMGFRLAGHTLDMHEAREMFSSGVTAGTVQLPPAGSPIVLMADRQTTGGYPRLGDVISVDLPLLAQLRPGETVRFTLVSLEIAQALLLHHERDLVTARRGLELLLHGIA